MFEIGHSNAMSLRWHWAHMVEALKMLWDLLLHYTNWMRA